MKRSLQAFAISLLFSAALAGVVFALAHLWTGLDLAIGSYADGELSARWAVGMAFAMCLWTAPKFYAAYRAVQLAVTWKPAA